MISGISLLSAGFILRRKQSYFKDFYSQIQNCKKYHLDFVDQLSKLPRDKGIILFGPPKSQTQTGKERVLIKSIIKKNNILNKQPLNQQQKQTPKQFTTPKYDRLWKFSMKDDIFYLQTLSNQKIFVEQDKNQQLYAFNLLQRKSNDLWQQRVIVRNQPVCVYGRILNQGGKAVLKTKLVMGTKNQSFLQFIDKQIIKLNKRSKYFTFAGIGCFLAHMVYIKLTKNNLDALEQSQEPIIKVQKTKQEDIIQDMKKFQKEKK